MFYVEPFEHDAIEKLGERFAFSSTKGSAVAQAERNHKNLFLLTASDSLSAELPFYTLPQIISVLYACSV